MLHDSRARKNKYASCTQQKNQKINFAHFLEQKYVFVFTVAEDENVGFPIL